MNKHLEIILKKMFETIGEYDVDVEEFVKKENWFSEREWTVQQSEVFQSWLSKYLKKTKKARELFGLGSYSDFDKAAEGFVFNYGFKYKEDIRK
jgi:hypothetical protein